MGFCSHMCLGEADFEYEDTKLNKIYKTYTDTGRERKRERETDRVYTCH